MIPDTNGQVFGAGKFAFHKVNIKVQVTVVYFLQYYVFNDLAQFFGIIHKAGLRIRFSLYGYM
ncbi:hypothetical protein D3C87_2028720 [compost metagenome]